MFGYELFDFETATFTEEAAAAGVTLKDMGDYTLVSGKTRGSIVKFITAAEYTTSGQKPNREDLQEIKEMIFKI